MYGVFRVIYNKTMRLLRIGYATPDENLACDEWLLDRCSRELLPGSGVLRLWESSVPFAVLGFSNHAELELHLDNCTRDKIPVVRRRSGGGTVLQGPGCLNYSLIVPLSVSKELTGITRTNNWVLTHHQQALETLLPGNRVQIDGMSDLTLDGKKFSGNAQRRLKNAVLMHGTFLYGFDLKTIDRYLRLPPRQPAYRNNRPHPEFLINLPLSSAQIQSAIATCWNAVEPGIIPPDEEITRLAHTRAN